MGFRVDTFDIWRPGYGGATVHIKNAADDSDAAVFYDAALTETAANPQVLQTYSEQNVSYGKFSRPIYTSAAYYLIINSIDRTGIVSPPLTTLAGATATESLVTAAGGSVARTLAALLADAINVENHGVILPVGNPSASASTNTTTLAAAIGVASARGGGYVLVPEGTFLFTTLSIPANVILKGQGEGVTILQSVQGSNVITLSGDAAGIEDITIDGVSNQASSIGIYMLAQDKSRIRRAKLMRFATGLKMQGGNIGEWESLSIDACVSGALLHGDVNGVSANGDVCKHNAWRGGRVSNCTTVGVELKFIDRQCWHNTLSGVGFEDNTGVALRAIGARWTRLEDDCWFDGNTTDIAISDGSDTTLAADNTVVGFHMRGGVISGDMTFTGKCQDVIFDGVEFADGTYTLTTVLNSILTVDCIESGDVALAGGDATKWTRHRRQLGDFPNSSGVTTDNVATEAWSYNLAPGEKIHVEAIVIANGRNTIDHAMYHIGQSAQRPGSTLAYDGQSANFTLGAILTGGTSGATARITADSDSGATGTLTLRDIVGEFVDNEAITDSVTGVAVANGVLAHQNAALLGSITNIEAVVESDSDFACIFGVSADEVRVLVTGDTGKTVEWTVAVKVTSG